MVLGSVSSAGFFNLSLISVLLLYEWSAQNIFHEFNFLFIHNDDDTFGII